MLFGIVQVPDKALLIMTFLLLELSESSVKRFCANSSQARHSGLWCCCCPSYRGRMWQQVYADSYFEQGILSCDAELECDNKFVPTHIPSEAFSFVTLLGIITNIYDTLPTLRERGDSGSGFVSRKGQVGRSSTSDVITNTCIFF